MRTQKTLTEVLAIALIGKKIVLYKSFYNRNKPDTYVVIMSEPTHVYRFEKTVGKIIGVTNTDYGSEGVSINLEIETASGVIKFSTEMTNTLTFV